MIHRQADKMAKLVSQLLNMTRMEQGIDSAKMERMDLCKFVKDFCREQHWDASRLTLKTVDDILVTINPELLGRLITNLVENAWKYGSDEKPVQITVMTNRQEALLMVQDYGIGISSEDQEKIWQRFYQVDASRSNQEGSGLGLSMVKQIAKLHGGYMTLDSSLGKGSTFTLHLPL
jgi:signal transduction histidine kinase